MKQILLWDPRFPGRAPLRLTVDDQIASAAARAGVATAADPALAGALANGAAVDPSAPTAVYLQHGLGSQRIELIVLPLAVAQIAAGLGLAAGVPLAIAAGLQAGTLDFSDPTQSALIL